MVTAAERFRSGVRKAVTHLGGDRTAAARSGVSKAIWYDAKTGRSVPGDQRWPAMRALLESVPAGLTGVPDWETLYRQVLAGQGRRPPRPALHQLPPGTLPFVAREAESRRISELLDTSGGRSTSMVVITGPPGVGKTALAVNWAHQARDRFPDGVLYVDLQGWGPARELTAAEVLPGWLRALGLDPAALPGDVASRTAALRDAAAARRMLFVLDNAGSEEQVRPLLPGSPACAVLLTSRHELSGLGVHHGGRTVTLAPLSAADSAGLVREIAGAGLAGHAERIARLCGHLPLALRVVATSLPASSHEEVSALVEELESRGRLDRLGSDDPRTDVRTVISWSFHRLPEPARDTVRLLGHFPGRVFSTAVVSALTGGRRAQTLAHLRVLTRASLVHREPDGRYAMHDLVRDYAAELAAANPDDGALTRVYGYYLHVCRRADAWIAPRRYQIDLPDGDDPPPAPFDDYDGALSWLESESGTMLALCLGSAGPERADPLRWRLAFQLKSYYFLSKRTQEWLLSHEAALAATIRIGDRRAEAMTRNNLGLAWHELGDDDRARPQYERAEQLFAAVGDPHGVSNAVASQAVVHRRRGDLRRALELSERALGRYREAAADHPDARRYIAITLRSLALAETEARDYEKAEVHLREAAGLCAELGMTMDLARSWNALGRALVLAGRHPDAVEAYRAAARAAAECGSRYEQALADRGLGTVAAAAGDTGEAHARWTRAYTVLAALGSAKAAEVRADLDGQSS
ncbi:ATP-binding protein [Actinoplanes sp. NPDC048988]|uniref:ATP-binding protein n=1 Tax=Actinoplanes sp. NPDC048988 TaxID=3363901 RepID=UPI003722EF4D